MTGLDIIALRLRENEALTQIVPAANIRAGTFPEGVALPTLLLRTISSNERIMLSRGPFVRTDERVSVSVRARTYRDQVRIIALVRSACAGAVLPDFAHGEETVFRVAIQTAGTGPDLIGPGNTFEQATDFRVSFDAPA